MSARFFSVAGLILLAACVPMLSTTSVSCVRGTASPVEAAYGSKVKFKEGRALRLPDFELTYRGRRRVTPPQYPRGWWVDDFKVRAGSSEQTVSWSAGTGDIGPVQFRVGATLFQIELVRSDKLGPLTKDELVVSNVN